MSDSKDKLAHVLEQIEDSIATVEKGHEKWFFYTIDSKGNPNGGIEYIYQLAYQMHEQGKHVVMLYDEKLTEKKDEMGELILDEGGKVVKVDPFVGVGGWMGEKYASLEHKNVFTDKVDIAPSDFLLIPEIFVNIMRDTMHTPCKRIAVVTNYDYAVRSVPMGEQWGNYGIKDCIVESDFTAQQIKDLFPYVNVMVVNPYVEEGLFGLNEEKKELVVNILAENSEDIIKVVNPFYWKFPMFRWVVFRELKSLKYEDYADKLNEGEITLYLNDDTTFGIGAVQAMKAKNVVVGKLPNIMLDFVYNNEEKDYNKCGFWFDDIKSAPNVLANVIRMYITDSVPQEIYDAQAQVADTYNIHRTSSQIHSVIETMVGIKKEELNKSLEVYKNKSK